MNEASIYYVNKWLAQTFEFPTGHDEKLWGLDILAALAEVWRTEPEDEDGDRFCPFIGCLDRAKWECGCGMLANAILWDRDFEMGGSITRGGPLAAMVRQHAHISAEYFHSPPVQALSGALARLTTIFHTEVDKHEYPNWMMLIQTMRMIRIKSVT